MFGRQTIASVRGCTAPASFTILLVLALTACGGGSSGGEPGRPPAPQDPPPAPPPAARAPEVDAGADRRLEWPENTAELSGSVTHQNPEALTYSWRVTAGPPGVQFATPDRVDTIVTFPREGTYTIALTASDGSLSGEDTLQVQVDPALYPTETWTSATPAEMNMDATLLDQARDYAVNTNAAGGSGMIVRRGRLVYAWGDIATRYEMKSTTKSIGSIALALAFDDGVLRLEDLAQARLPRLGVPPSTNQATGWLERITVEQLATHTAGFAKPDGLDPANDAGPALLFEPGTTWSYSDAGLNWLADLLTVTFNEDLQTVLDGRVFATLGITRDDLRWRDNSFREPTLEGIARRELASGMEASIDAMARIGYLFLRKGRWAGEQLIREASIELLRTPRPSVADTRIADPVNFPDATGNHAVLWWTNSNGALADVPSDAYWAWGLGDSLIVVIPSLDLVVARATTQEAVSGPNRSGWTNGWNGDYAWLAPFLTPIAQSVSE
ncbi:MAG: hypothetical protein DIU71_05255 [Proteobacteria bacterium]|nr:MAG: hypothetical protein DIU71_05255 [Pseudomonadota bacterium]